MLQQPSKETTDFILQHREEDVRKLALKGQRGAAVNMTFALQQIDGWQRARTKLPMWAEHDGIIFPPHISMEQCSSEATALYKQRLVRRLVPETSQARMADLTGGFGVDFSYMSQGFKEAFYIEQQEHLCDIARHNFAALGMVNSHVINGVAEDALATLPSLDLIYLDPARRDTHGKKTYAISDCTPDVTTLLPLLREKAANIIVKLSPMLDHREAIRLLPGVTEVHIISVRNECKETLLVFGKANDSCQVVCVNDGNTFVTKLNDQQTVATAADIEVGMDLFVPNASIMKAGCFGALCSEFGIAPIDHNSHLFVSCDAGKNHNTATPNGIPAENFPGKVFRIKAVSTMNKRELKAALAGITQANIATRNFPLSVEALKTKLRGVAKLRDGGETYIFATTAGGRHILIITEKHSRQ